jgi:glutamyl-tRNA synthetase
VRGVVTFEALSLNDPVLLKSDGFPTYHLAVVVDDHEMQISHVFRGDEWIATAPIHLLIYEALGWTPPVMVHTPSILGPDGKKFSKRHGAQTSRELREAGYLPDAVFNFLVLVGWSPGGGEEGEIFPRNELVSRFSLDHVSASSGVYDSTKLEWMNGAYIRSLSDQQFHEAVTPFFERAGVNVEAFEPALRSLAPHLRERSKTLADVPPMVDFLLDQPSEPGSLADACKKGMDEVGARKVLVELQPLLEKIEPWDHTAIEVVCRHYAEHMGLKSGVAFTVLRVALLRKSVTPPLFESLQALGKDEVLRRLRLYGSEQ